MQVIPTLYDGTPFYTLTTVLDNNANTFDFQWNDREQSWYFDLYDKNGNLLVGSTKVSLSVPLLATIQTAGMPPGFFMAIDTSQTDTMPGLTDLGARVQLLYVTAVDIQQIAAGTFDPNAPAN